jgi:hypothetical protein
MKYLAVLCALAASAAIGYRMGRKQGRRTIRNEADAIHESIDKFVAASNAYMSASQKPLAITPEPVAVDTRAPATPDDWNKSFIVDLRREGNC